MFRMKHPILILLAVCLGLVEPKLNLSLDSPTDREAEMERSRPARATQKETANSTDPVIRAWLGRVFNFDAHENQASQGAAAVADDPNVRWGQADSLAIQIDENADAWQSGRVIDVLALDSGGLLVGTETGGVWSVTSVGQALPLSNDWDDPDITALVFGPDGSRHFYAGCGGSNGALYETDTSDPLPILAWRQITIPMQTGAIYRVGVLRNSRRIVLACQNGVWWSPIPAAPSARGMYNWQQAPGLPGGTYSGLAVGPNDTFAVALWGPQNCPGTATLTGIFTGAWTSGNLQMTCSTINGVTVSQVSWISLASCDSNRNVMYALTTDSNGQFLAALRSNDGGRNWNATGQTLDGNHSARWTIRSLFGDSGSGGWFKHISVSPSNTETVAFGSLNPFISTNGGQNWRALGGQWTNPETLTFTPHHHADVHVIYFDPNNNRRLHIASDGGVATSSDLGGTFSSFFNRQLLTLQFYSTVAARNFAGTLAVNE